MSFEIGLFAHETTDMCLPITVVIVVVAVVVVTVVVD